MRTSQTHPLQIATVAVPGAPGRVGITFCPGKKQSDAMTGAWDRDLDVDLDAVRAWGAHALVTLIEDHELRDLQVTGLGDGVRERDMTWFHLPIRDYHTPEAVFEAAWSEAGPRLGAVLREGHDVVVHCKGGIGRAGTIAARLLVEAGCAPQAAVDAVRAARPGAIETEDQHLYVLSLRTGASA